MSSRLGKPGEFPFTRGIYPGMYRNRLWTMRQYAGFGSAEESNRRYHYLLSQGTTGLSVAFDLPTQMGLDSDHPMAAGEVGRVGVAIASLADMETLFQGIKLESVSTSMTINSTASILLAFYSLAAQRQGGDRRKLQGTIQNDILKEYVARGTYIYPPRPAMRLITDIFAWAGARCPNGTPSRSAAIIFAKPVRPPRRNLLSRSRTPSLTFRPRLTPDFAVDSFAPRLSFFFNSHNGFLEEIAKFRAARRIYAHIVRDRFGAKDARSWALRFHVQTAGSTLTAQQPDVNIVRTAVQALAAVLGGAQSLHTNSRDEALSLPTEESARIALRTQQIVAYESGVVNTADPVGGSEAIEALTDQLEREAFDYIARIDEQGGALRAIEAGYIQNQIQNAAYEYQREIESGARIVVGVNRFQQEDGREIPSFRIDPALEAAQVERLRQVRASRSAAEWERSLAALEAAARGDSNLMPYIVDAAASLATVGEISGRLRGVFGEYRES